MLRVLIFFLWACAVKAQVEDDYDCPSSPAMFHASCKVYTVFENPCTTVQQEMMKRINGQEDGSWTDPHNGGNYTLLDDPAGLPATWKFSRVTGDGKYTDLLNYAFYAYGETSCQMYGCSESQVFSIGDYGTNFCNIHDLYCNDKECQLHSNLHYTEEFIKCNQHHLDSCY